VLRAGSREAVGHGGKERCGRLQDQLLPDPESCWEPVVGAPTFGRFSAVPRDARRALAQGASQRLDLAHSGERCEPTAALQWQCVRRVLVSKLKFAARFCLVKEFPLTCPVDQAQAPSRLDTLARRLEIREHGFKTRWRASAVRSVVRGTA